MFSGKYAVYFMASGVAEAGMTSEGFPDKGLGRQGIFKPDEPASAIKPPAAPTQILSSSPGEHLFATTALLALAILALVILMTLSPGSLPPVLAITLAATLSLCLIGVAYVWFRRDRAVLAQAKSQEYAQALENLARLRREQRQLARRYREEKLRAEAASRSKTAFLAHLSHDVRTPLNHIIGFADLLKHQAFGPMGDARYLEYVEDIKRSGERLLFSFAEILELAELEAGKRALNMELIDLDDLMVSLQDQFQSSANHCGIRLNICGVSGLRIMGDRVCLSRMLGNLLDNSMRFTGQGGQVSVTVWEAGDGIVLSVSDTGIGIPPEQLKALCTPFALDDAALTRSKGGMGLGLAISRSIAELSGGELVIESAPAVGTTVAISLPHPVAESVLARPAA